MNLYIQNHNYQYELENLCRVFFPNEKINVFKDATLISSNENFVLAEKESVAGGYNIKLLVSINSKIQNKEKFVSKNQENIDDEIERIFAFMLFEILSKITSTTPPWGVLTGVRPIKLMRNLINKNGQGKAVLYFKNKLLVSEEKTNLACKVAETQKEIISLSSDKSFSLYISIPFCPTRCSYCSFVSQSVEKSAKLIPEYLKLLQLELEHTSKIVKQLGLKLETVYIGGGTPTVLSAQELNELIVKINLCFDMKSCREFTVEAGRPDTITEEKLSVLKRLGVTRISINPQTLNDNTLSLIGRRHTAMQAIDSFKLARECGFSNINMDLIAGLPNETFEDFKNTLKKVIELNPENITVHTLALKRASFLKSDGKKILPQDTYETERMVNFSRDILNNFNYKPYYLYRQSKMLGNLENVGYCKAGYENLYNIYIMEEIHSIISCGAGGVTKLKNPYSNEIERIFNFKFAYEYKERFPEIINRKNKVLIFYDNLEKPIL